MCRGHHSCFLATLIHPIQKGQYWKLVQTNCCVFHSQLIWYGLSFILSIFIGANKCGGDNTTIPCLKLAILCQPQLIKNAKKYGLQNLMMCWTNISTEISCGVNSQHSTMPTFPFKLFTGQKIPLNEPTWPTIPFSRYEKYCKSWCRNKYNALKLLWKMLKLELFMAQEVAIKTIFLWPQISSSDFCQSSHTIT